MYRAKSADTFRVVQCSVPEEDIVIRVLLGVGAGGAHACPLCCCDGVPEYINVWQWLRLLVRCHFYESNWTFSLSFLFSLSRFFLRDLPHEVSDPPLTIQTSSSNSDLGSDAQDTFLSDMI